MSKNRLSRPSTLLLLLGLSLSLVACNRAREVWEWPQRAKQIRTHVTLYVIATNIGKSDAPLNEKRLKEFTHTYADGKDEWGNEILVAWRASQGQPQGGIFLLVSRGADGKLDVPEIEDYFEIAEPEWVDGEFDRDLVFRNQEPIQIGAKT